jgi:ABC-type amino acid transport substrate-binding protein
MKMPLVAVAALCALVSSCGLPKDTDGTLERVRAAREFRVGLILGGPRGALDPRARALLERVGRAAGARPRLIGGDAEPLLARLEEGELDLVVGRFTKTTPWATLVSLTPPLATEKQGRTEIILAAAMANGENEWISLLEREARQLPGVEQ